MLIMLYLSFKYLNNITFCLKVNKKYLDKDTIRCIMEVS